MGNWIKGRGCLVILNPENGKTYHCTMQLRSADALSVHGYIGVPLMGRSVLWPRFKPPPR